MFNQKMFDELKTDALERHIPIIMDDTLDKIKEILEQENPENILEIGTAVGYSAICFAKYSHANIDTIEIDADKYEEAKKNIEVFGLEDRINIYFGNAVDILPTLKKKYDIIFIDAAKSKYNIFLEESLKLINNDGIILADNILYKGYVMSDYNKHKQRTAVRHLREYIKDVTENEILDTQILEIGDGLAISRVKK